MTDMKKSAHKDFNGALKICLRIKIPKNAVRKWEAQKIIIKEPNVTSI